MKTLINNIFNKLKLKSCEIGPNYQFIDGLKALKGLVLLSLSSTIFNKYLLICQQKIAEFLTLSPQSKNSLTLTDCGRTSLYLLLESLKKSQAQENKTEVVFQAFTCAVLPNSILQAGLKPIMADINDENYNFDTDHLEKKISSQTLAIILQYTFGYTPTPTQIKKITDLCRLHKVVIIEDLAHGLGGYLSTATSKKMLGNFGQAAILSFGRDKIISSTIGGAHYLNFNHQQDYQPDMLKWQNQLKDMEVKKLQKMSTLRVLQALNYIWLTALIIRPLYHFIIGKAVLFLARKINLIGKIYTLEEANGTNQTNNPSYLPAVLAFILNQQIDRIKKYNQHRQKIAGIYHKILTPKLNFNPDIYPLRFVIQAPTPQTWIKIKQNLKQIGTLAGLWYNSLILPSNFDLQKHLGYTPKSLPNAESLSNKKVLNLPTNIHISQADAILIANVVKNTL